MREKINHWIIETLQDMSVDVDNIIYDENMNIQGIDSLQFIQLVVYIET